MYLNIEYVIKIVTLGFLIVYVLFNQVNPFLGASSAVSYSICDICISHLQNAFIFKQQVVGCERILSSYCNSQDFKGIYGVLFKLNINKNTLDVIQIFLQSPTFLFS